MKQTLTAILAGIGLSALANPPIITNVTAQQRYPWNGKVDITCTVSGIEEATGRREFAVAVVDSDSDDACSVSHVKILREGAEWDDLTISSNGIYWLVWDAAADLGEVNRSNMVVRVTAKVFHGKVQLWEGGPYWAETNVGAEEPEEYGLYFWWGDTIGYRREGNAWVASDGSSQNFSFVGSDNTPTHNKSVATLRREGWVVTKGETDILAPEHDAAQAHWGGSWRMPTIAEFSALDSNCVWTWTSTNGVNGYVVRGCGDYASASIFLPATGFGFESFLYSGGGSCWSSVPSSDSDDTRSRYLYFNSGGHGTSLGARSYGRSVRPVQGFTE